MLKWCSLCQRFQGEQAPFETFTYTHTVCPACAIRAFEHTEQELRQSLFLRGIHDELRRAGQQSDVRAASALIEKARDAGYRPIDILIGVIAPLLYEIGEHWARNEITVAEEHAFTAFCEQLYERVADRVRAARADRASSALPPVEVLLLNAPDNTHTVGIRLLDLWLLGEGTRAEILDRASSPDAVLAAVQRVKPLLLMISLALAEHRAGVEAVVRRVMTLDAAERPIIIVGGNAVKMGMVAPIAGAHLVADLTTVHLGMGTAGFTTLGRTPAG